MGPDEGTMLRELRRTVDETAFYAWSGISVVSATAGEVDVAMEADPRHLNIQGLVHGGMLATLADTAMGLAVRTTLEPGSRHVTIQLGVQFLSAGREGRISARGRVVRSGRQIAHAEAEVMNEAGRVLARAQSTVAVMADRDGSELPVDRQ
jgi:uncharacterized protein (TIGR00369 family)